MMSAPLPRITIGITCYNAEETIARAIQSALEQDWPDKEILVVDDASGDRSRDIIQGFSDRNVKLIAHAQNTGIGGARQSLLDAATGAYLVFFDDDDESLPRRLRLQYEALQSLPPQSLAACYAAGTRVYPNGHDVDIVPPGREPVHPGGPAMADVILYFARPRKGWSMGVTPACALMASIETFKKTGGFDADFRRAEDLDFAVRLALMGGVFIGTQDRVFIQHATGGHDKNPAKNLKAERQLVRKHASYLKTRKMFFHAYSWPLLRHAHFEKNYGRFCLILFLLFLRNPVHTARHFLATAPRRLRHEKKMRRA